MPNVIMVKIAPIGKAVIEVTIPEGSRVSDALSAAKVSSTSENIHRNGVSVSMSDVLKAGDIITVVPAIRGGN